MDKDKKEGFWFADKAKAHLILKENNDYVTEVRSFSDTDSTMPLGLTEKPADAFK